MINKNTADTIIYLFVAFFIGFAFSGCISILNTNNNSISPEWKSECYETKIADYSCYCQYKDFPTVITMEEIFDVKYDMTGASCLKINENKYMFVECTPNKICIKEIMVRVKEGSQ